MIQETVPRTEFSKSKQLLRKRGSPVHCCALLYRKERKTRYHMLDFSKRLANVGTGWKQQTAWLESKFVPVHVCTVKYEKRMCVTIYSKYFRYHTNFFFSNIVWFLVQKLYYFELQKCFSREAYLYGTYVLGPIYMVSGSGDNPPCQGSFIGRCIWETKLSLLDGESKLSQSWLCVITCNPV